MSRTVHAVDAATAAQHLGTGRNTLLERLRNAGVTHSSGPRRNLPRQEYRQAGLFSTALTRYWQGDVQHLHEKLTITAAGIEFCRQLLEAETATEHTAPRAEQPHQGEPDDRHARLQSLRADAGL
jgi:phage antirepressor YoqD-like protein